MKYRYLGRSGLLVSRVCLGTMAFGNPEWGCEQDVASEMVPIISTENPIEGHIHRTERK